MTTRQLIVQTRAGLCNRLRTYLSASVLAEETGRELLLVWRANPACGARWRDLFTNPVAEIASLPPAAAALVDPDCDTARRAAESTAAVIAIRACTFLLHWTRWPEVMNGLRRLQPIAAVEQTVARTSRQFGPATIGVHVRRGDFARYLPQRHARLPALERYYQHLDDWHGSIFLATDGGASVEQAFCDRYGSRLIINPKREGGRDRPAGVQDALTDLYLLQCCVGVVGTQHSSFTDLALLGMPAWKLVSDAPSGRASLAGGWTWLQRRWHRLLRRRAS